MKKHNLFIIFFILSISGYTQSAWNCLDPLYDLRDSPFPVYHPNIDIPDIKENKLNYYYAEAVDQVCPEATSVLEVCSKGTYQYAYGKYIPDQPLHPTRNPLRDIEDGNSAYDVYYSAIAPYDSAGKPLVVILHGGGGGKNHSSVVAHGIEFARRGYVAIVPDYTTPKDPIFGGKEAEICSEEELLFGIQFAIRDVRAAIRKALYLSSISDDSHARIDPTKIFLLGFSFGSVTSLHLALMRENDFSSHSLTYNEYEMVFSETMDNLDICENDPACRNFFPPIWKGRDMQEFIGGISFSPAFLVRDELIRDDFRIPIILTHGTCDVPAPYYTATAQQLLYRKAILNNYPDAMIHDSVPCYNSDGLSFDLFGSEYIYNKLKNTMAPFQNVGFLSFCGLHHAMKSSYGLQFSRVATETELRPGIYETFRFFAQILNGDTIPSFRFDFDHSIRAEVLSDHCKAQPKPKDNDRLLGTYYARIDTLCSRCISDTQFNPTLRYPFFSNDSNSDENRYLPLIEVFSEPPYEKCKTCQVTKASN